MTYNPVVRNGRFEVSNGTTTKTYSAVDEAQAKFKFCKGAGIAFKPGQLSARTVLATRRQF